MRYQSHDAPLAPASVGPFGQSVRDAVAVARQARNLSESDRQLLDDLARRDERYHHKSLERLTAILARVDNALLRESFAEGVLSAIGSYRGGPDAPSLHEALLIETSAVADADRAQHEVVLNPNAPLSAFDRAVSTMQRQIAASRVALSSMCRARFERVQGRHA